MLGGGIGSFIGDIHRKAAALDGQMELICGCFSSDADRSQKSGNQLGLPAERVYGSANELFDRERSLPEEDRMDVISITTPNHLHFEQAKMALENGFHVICDKPLTVTLEQARKLKKIVDETGLIFAVTYTYTGYPMVKEARHLIENGTIGELRKVVVEYPQGWLSTRMEDSNKQAAWRTDPNKSGKAGSMADIGTHAENLIIYITDLQITELCADLATVVEGRDLDDDGNVMLRFDNGANGLLFASQVCAGEDNNLKIFVYGEDGGLEWHQEHPNTLWVKKRGEAVQKYRSGLDHSYLSDRALYNMRVPAGHPEGYIEAFANIYRNVAEVIGAIKEGRDPNPHALDFPGIEDGAAGMAFIETVVKSARSKKKWTEMIEY